MDRNGSNPRPLTADLDRSVGSPVWADDGRSIYVDYDDEGVTKVARVSLDGSIRAVAEGLSGSSLDRPYTGGSFSVAAHGALAVTTGTATRPANIPLQKGGDPHQLQHLNTNHPHPKPPEK